MKPRLIKHIVLHCTGTDHSVSVQSIQNYWRSNLGWTRPGYHYIVLPSGTLIQLANHDEVTNGVAGHNANSLHISYIGGQQRNNRNAFPPTIAQLTTLDKLLSVLIHLYPAVPIVGHRDFPHVAKLCPNYDFNNLIDSLYHFRVKRYSIVSGLDGYYIQDSVTSNMMPLRTNDITEAESALQSFCRFQLGLRSF